MNIAKQTFAFEPNIYEPDYKEKCKKTHDKVLLYINKAIECDSNCFDCYMFLHKVQSHEYDYKGLVSTYNQLLKFDSTHITNHFMRGENYITLKDSLSASRDFQYILWACKDVKPSNEVQGYFLYRYIYLSEYYLYGIDRILELEREILKSPKVTNQQIGCIEDVKTQHEHIVGHDVFKKYVDSVNNLKTNKPK
ncbi:MAG: hypothetical protein IT244_01110 [Bacteroidia bacterium]|nr:hypothetical protein [Bacteroidia bacterium]